MAKTINNAKLRDITVNFNFNSPLVELPKVDAADLGRYFAEAGAEPVAITPKMMAQQQAKASVEKESPIKGVSFDDFKAQIDAEAAKIHEECEKIRAQVEASFKKARENFVPANEKGNETPTKGVRSSTDSDEIKIRALVEERIRDITLEDKITSIVKVPGRAEVWAVGTDNPDHSFMVKKKYGNFQLYFKVW